MSIAIPESDIQAFIKFAVLPKSKKIQLFDLLSQAEKNVDYISLATKLSDETSIPKEVTISTIRLMLQILRTNERKKIDKLDIRHDFERALNDYLSEVEDEESLLSEDVITETFDLIFSFENQNLLISFVAFGLVYENKNTLNKVTVIPEIRPVFTNDQYQGIVLYNTLRLEYDVTPEDESRDFYIAIDDDDIEALISALKEAKVKGKLLSDKFASDLISKPSA